MAEYRDIGGHRSGHRRHDGCHLRPRAPARACRCWSARGSAGRLPPPPGWRTIRGVASVSGADLSDALYRQASGLGVEFSFGPGLPAYSPSRTAGLWCPATAATLPAAAWCWRRAPITRGLGLPREQELTGRGASATVRCATGAFYRRQGPRAVVGGGSAALQSAEYLCGVCEKVILIHPPGPVPGRGRPGPARHRLPQPAADAGQRGDRIPGRRAALRPGGGEQKDRRPHPGAGGRPVSGRGARRPATDPLRRRWSWTRRATSRPARTAPPTCPGCLPPATAVPRRCGS